jgi:hypothetical protein
MSSRPAGFPLNSSIRATGDAADAADVANTAPASANAMFRMLLIALLQSLRLELAIILLPKYVIAITKMLILAVLPSLRRAASALFWVNPAELLTVKWSPCPAHAPFFTSAFDRERPFCDARHIEGADVVLNDGRPGGGNGDAEAGNRPLILVQVQAGASNSQDPPAGDQTDG